MAGARLTWVEAEVRGEEMEEVSMANLRSVVMTETKETWQQLEMCVCGQGRDCFFFP